MNFSSARAAVVDTLASEFVPLRVEAHGGRFTERELALVLGKAPCILVALLGLSRYVGRGRRTWMGELDLSVFFLVKDDGADARADLAMDAANRLVDLLPEQRWGLDEQVCRPPLVPTITAENIYTGHANNLRVALWAVAWTQSFTFHNGVFQP